MSEHPLAAAARQPIVAHTRAGAGGHTNRHRLKLRLLSAGRLHNVCAMCRLGPRWNDQPLMFVLDHINGINDDYRPDNLRLLCPNCNSQTPTFAGRNRQKSDRRPIPCITE